MYTNRRILPAVLLICLVLLAVSGCERSTALQPWHTERLETEFTAEMVGDSEQTFKDYQALEGRLFQELNERIYSLPASEDVSTLSRYRSGSIADPRNQKPAWNRSFELARENAVGTVLLLHGMSDSPYSMRSIGLDLSRQGYHVVGLRLPGHGTIPSGLQHVQWQDMSAATALAATRLTELHPDRPLHIIGYSTGASLALDYAIQSLGSKDLKTPASLVLISPAIRVHPTSRLAAFKDSLSVLPGLQGMAYLSIMEEFDPYKYNSFATNAAAQVFRVTSSVYSRLAALDQQAKQMLPPILVLKSTVDSTVTTEAVVDRLLKRLPANRNEIVLYDINRHAGLKSTLLNEGQGALTTRLLAGEDMPFAVTVLANDNSESREIAVYRKEGNAAELSVTRGTGLFWPDNVVSLSHIALPFPPNDPLYGNRPPADDSLIYLGNLAFLGERGLVRIPNDWLLRMRYNPFYDYQQYRISHWLESNADLEH